MGYCMTQMEHKFNIKRENIPMAWEALKKVLKGSKINSWVDNAGALNARNFEETMKKCRWEVESYESDGIDNIEFYGEKLGDDAEVFAAIAPYVEPDSYIQMQGEDGYIWRWVFDGKTVEEKTGRIVFD